jgi:hypothetical protein
MKDSPSSHVLSLLLYKMYLLSHPQFMGYTVTNSAEVVIAFQKLLIWKLVKVKTSVCIVLGYRMLRILNLSYVE